MLGKILLLDQVYWKGGAVLEIWCYCCPFYNWATLVLLEVVSFLRTQRSVTIRRPQTRCPLCRPGVLAMIHRDVKENQEWFLTKLVQVQFFPLHRFNNWWIHRFISLTPFFTDFGINTWSWFYCREEFKDEEMVDVKSLDIRNFI